MLHGGCAGRWYFDWFEERYPTQVERQIGVEAFAPRPEDLPPEIEWLQQSLGDLRGVADGAVDVVFAGQVIEHLWPDEVAGFLLESSRVLRPGGLLAVDSPNRRVTTAIGWEHPEHTVEFRVDEIAELLELAGFDEIRIRGLWLCFDREHNRFLSLEGGPGERAWSPERRAAEAEARPEDSFVWWAEAVRGDREPEPARLRRRVSEIYDDYRRFRFGRLKHTVGSESGVGADRLVAAGAGESGHLVFGPFVPMKAGRWVVRFRAAAGPVAGLQDGVLGVVDVVTAPDASFAAAEEVVAATLPPDGVLHEIALPFELEHAELSVEFRLLTTGLVPMAALLHVRVEPQDPQAEAGSARDVGLARA